MSKTIRQQTKGSRLAQMGKGSRLAQMGRPPKSDQLIQVTLKFKMPGGKIRVQTLQDEEAQRWRDWAEAVCFSAWHNGMNPDWSALNWAIHEQV